MVSDITEQSKIHSKKIILGKSSIHGTGIIAKRPIEKGEIIFYIKGKITHFRVRHPKDSNYGPDWVGIGEDLWIDPRAPAKYINHSCSPSVGISGKVTLRALRHINKGEEVTLDYSITEQDKHWRMNCRCGKNCRKKIRSIQFLDNQTFKKYLPYIPNFFQKVYYKEHENK